MKNTLKTITIISIIFSMFLFVVANACWAITILPAPSNCTVGADYQDYSYSNNSCEGNYSLNDFVQIAVNVSTFILGITGSLALLAFIYGGVMFLISAGSSERVTQAKQIIVGAVIGMLIVFTSFMIIQFVFTALNIPNSNNGQWAKIGWFK